MQKTVVRLIIKYLYRMAGKTHLQILFFAVKNAILKKGGQMVKTDERVPVAILKLLLKNSPERTTVAQMIEVTRFPETTIRAHLKKLRVTGVVVEMRDYTTDCRRYVYSLSEVKKRDGKK
jgi:Fic family protein